MLKEQHMPRSVGNMLKMLEQFSLAPFQEHHLRRPVLMLIKQLLQYIPHFWHYISEKVDKIIDKYRVEIKRL